MLSLILLALLVLSVVLTKTDHNNCISAKVICDSVNPNGDRLTTFELVFPKWMVAEYNTHRMLSRNSASSRAIPIQQILRAILTQPATYVFWGRNRPGMQSVEELVGWRLWLSKKLAFWLRYPVCGVVWLMNKIGLHKQNGNRYLEPWMYTTVISSGTEWENFFRLRTHKDAQPEFQDLAKKMQKLYDANVPKKLGLNEWHLPYVTTQDWNEARALSPAGHVDMLRKISVARCARVSYVRQNVMKDAEEDFKLCERLISSGHCSPLEHQAKAVSFTQYIANFKGWEQFRKTIAGESGRKENVQ